MSEINEEKENENTECSLFGWHVNVVNVCTSKKACYATAPAFPSSFTYAMALCVRSVMLPYIE